MILKAGDSVIVRSKADILATLDRNGRCDGLPFMPQMFQYCGQRFKVYKRAHKTCDTVNKTGGRRVTDCIHLDLRCDGEAYGGCQAACLIFWKTAWLQRVDDDQFMMGEPDESGTVVAAESPAGCTVEDVQRATRRTDLPADEEVHYSCQATHLPEYTKPLRWWHPWQYIEDIVSKNSSVRTILGGFGYFAFRRILRLAPWRFRNHLVRGYDQLQKKRRGVPYPRKQGRIAQGQLTPTDHLDLQPGDLVRVKSYEEILDTLNRANKNRGLFFDAEMVPYCGGTYRIHSSVERFLDEKTGKMIHLKRPAWTLEGVWCRSRYSECRLACPRSIYSWWRDVWLEKLPAAAELDRHATGERTHE